jgi:hypothetical protein
MKRLLRLCVATALLVVSSAGYAAFHLFTIEQIYSNADGSVQFIVLVNPSVSANGESQWTGQSITSAGHTYTFASDLPSFLTGGKRALIATQGFAALGIVTPDYVVPNGFLSTPGGTINYADVDSVSYSALPTDGVHAIQRNGAVVPNVATNFAGTSASVGASATPAAFVPVDGLWANANELGTGYTLGYKHGVLVVAIYAYLPNGTAQWYLAAGPVINNVFTATLDRYTGGQCISCVFTGQPTLVGNDGSITITFTSNTSATVNLPGGRITQIAPFQF